VIGMPIVDVQLVTDTPGEPEPLLSQALADSLGAVFGSAPGRTWVRVTLIGAAGYAENGVVISGRDLPVFVTVLQAHPPAGETLAAEVHAVTAAVAACVDRPAQRVHVQYAPAAAGRVAFGGSLVR
jgi:phenylpyruvate tautomerase PptA (4-oxalocrotonate tautomerase family)